MRQFVLGFLFDTTGDIVLLVRKNRPPWQCGKANGIGGKIERGETPFAAMDREATEEAGVRGGQWVHFSSFRTPDPAERDIGLHEVHAFKLFSSVLLESAKTMTDEPIEKVGIMALPHVGCLATVHLLVALALNASPYPIILESPPKEKPTKLEPLTLHSVTRLCAKEFGAREGDLFACRSRVPAAIDAKFCAQFLLREAGYPSHEIAEFFGMKGGGNSTDYGVRQAKERASVDRKFAHKLLSIKDKVGMIKRPV